MCLGVASSLSLLHSLLPFRFASSLIFLMKATLIYTHTRTKTWPLPPSLPPSLPLSFSHLHTKLHAIFGVRSRTLCVAGRAGVGAVCHVLTEEEKEEEEEEEEEEGQTVSVSACLWEE